jgi:hypothetical protein
MQFSTTFNIDISVGSLQLVYNNVVSSTPRHQQDLN